MHGIELNVAGKFKSALAARLARPLPVKQNGRYTSFLLPELGPYEVVVLE